MKKPLENIHIVKLHLEEDSTPIYLPVGTFGWVPALDRPGSIIFLMGAGQVEHRNVSEPHDAIFMLCKNAQ